MCNIKYLLYYYTQALKYSFSTHLTMFNFFRLNNLVSYSLSPTHFHTSIGILLGSIDFPILVFLNTLSSSDSVILGQYKISVSYDASSSPTPLIGFSLYNL